MNENVKERRCKTCGKLLIGKKLPSIPLCRRCKLEIRKVVGNVGGIIGGGTYIAYHSAKAHANNIINKSDSDGDQDDEKHC